LQNEKKPDRELLIAGYGGQGVLTMGDLIINSGTTLYNHVSWLPSYDTFTRGGRVVCYVILSDEDILSPIISAPEIMVIMDSTALDIYRNTLVPGGTLIIDSCLVPPENVGRDDIKVFAVPASDMAQSILTIKITNLILLGVYLKLTDALPLDLVEDVMNKTRGNMLKDGLLTVNQEAIRVGYNFQDG
jgi:2-oxoglutarate ferredoxin oxidoreductase subunit gamma